MRKTGFSAGEVQVLSLTAAYENGCAWCVAFHTAMALKEGVDRDVVDALRQGAVPNDGRLAALTGFARAMVRNRGAIDPPTLQAFFAAGYSKRQAPRCGDGNGVLRDGQLCRPLDAACPSTAS